MSVPIASIELNDVDRRVWAEELDAFVPRRVFDVHTHYYRWEYNTSENKDAGAFADLVGDGFPESDEARLGAWDAALMPGRDVQRLSFGYPFSPGCDFEAMNGFVASEAGKTPGSGALMLVHPSMTPQYIEEQVRQQGFLGLKPYRFYSTTGDQVECRITDFLPEQQIEVAHRRGLVITLHLSKRNAIADKENVEDLLRLTEKYPGAKWILAHCARSYSGWVLERAVKQLQGLPNVWYDTSSVCESDVFAALIAGVGKDRVMYGSDDLPVGVARGKYIVFGYAWAFLSEKNQSFDLSHCNPQMTFVRYEQLRAMRRAALSLGLTRLEIEDLFYNTAAWLVESIRDTARRLG